MSCHENQDNGLREGHLSLKAIVALSAIAMVSNLVYPPSFHGLIPTTVEQYPSFSFVSTPPWEDRLVLVSKLTRHFPKIRLNPVAPSEDVALRVAGRYNDGRSNTARGISLAVIDEEQRFVAFSKVSTII